MKGKFYIIALAVVAALIVVGVSLGASSDQGRRLSGPFCVGKTDQGANAGVVRSIGASRQCRSYEIRKNGVAVSGPAGPAGPKGAAGSQGNGGGDGAPGANGANGLDGKDGKSVALSYISNREDEGPCDGASSYDGNLGVALTVGDETLYVCNGRPGRNGEQGEQGNTGAAGPKGDTGATGPAGPQGEPGKDGRDGKDGDDHPNSGGGNGSEDDENGDDQDPGNSGDHNNGKD